MIIDHGVGNIGSLKNALAFLGFDPIPIRNKESYRMSKNPIGFILPGVGTFDEGMKNLREKSLDYVIEELVNIKVRGLAICLGMQLLCERSEESSRNEKGLGYFKASVKLLNNAGATVPSIGWNTTYAKEGAMGRSAELLTGDFYYLHSYSVHCSNDNDRIAYYGHGDSQITSAIEKDFLLGVQFHPEKSQYQGLSLIKNYFGGEK